MAKKKKAKYTIFDVIKSRDITMTDVARSTGVSLAYVSRVFHGTREPRVSIAMKMAQYIGISIEEFIAICG